MTDSDSLGVHIPAHISYPENDDEATHEWPEVPYSDPAWADPDTWELGPAIPRNAVLIVPAVGLHSRRFKRRKGGRR